MEGLILEELVRGVWLINVDSEVFFFFEGIE